MLIAKQLAECSKKAPDCTHYSNLGVKVIMNEADLSDIQAEITGPTGTPYENGIYRCTLTV